jgi:valacyclovir hydrolase
VRVDGRNIHVVRVGGGPHPLLLLPGALGSATTDFAPQLAGFDQVGLA